MSQIVDLAPANAPRAEHRASEVLLRQARRIETRSAVANDPDVQRALARLTFPQQLRAFENLKETLFPAGCSPTISWNLYNAATAVVQASMLTLSDEECIQGLATYAEHYRGDVRHTAHAIIGVAKVWPKNFFYRSSLMVLPPEAYNGLVSSTRHQWSTYVAAQLLLPQYDLNDHQRVLASVLSLDWQGSGNSLLETVRALANS